MIDRTAAKVNRRSRTPAAALANTQAKAHEGPRPGPRPVKNQAIVAAARALFLSDGYGVTSMDAIARRACVSKATLYAHFRTKEDLFSAIVRSETAILIASLTAPDLEKTDPRTALTRIGRSYQSMVLSPRALGLFRLVVGEGIRFPDIARSFHQSGPGRFLTLLATYLKQMNDAGSLKISNPRRAAEQFFGMIRGEDHLRQLLKLDVGTGPARPAPGLVSDAVNMFLTAYAPLR